MDYPSRRRVDRWHRTLGAGVVKVRKKVIPSQRPVLVIDTETTGLDPEKDRIVEIAAVLVDPDKRLVRAYRDSVVDPGVPIPIESRAIHHLSDEDVVGKPTLASAMGEWTFGDDWVPAAHYAAFDSKFVPIEREWICTNRCAKHIWPDAPGHSNQVLRYWIPSLNFYANLEGRCMPPHRALPDAWVTAHVLIEMLKTHSVEDLVRLTKTPILLKKVGFGMHFGKEWKDVPRDYLSWVLRKTDFDPDVVHTARHWMNGGK